MTHKDKLIELIAKALDTPHEDELKNHIADFLLDEGVIAPPVKIGDKIWYIDGGYYNSEQMRAKEITVKEISLKRVRKDLNLGFIAGARYTYKGLGKTWFYTKEEAEEEIRKRKHLQLR